MREFDGYIRQQVAIIPLPAGTMAWVRYGANDVLGPFPAVAMAHPVTWYMLKAVPHKMPLRAYQTKDGVKRHAFVVEYEPLADVETFESGEGRVERSGEMIGPPEFRYMPDDWPMVLVLLPEFGRCENPWHERKEVFFSEEAARAPDVDADRAAEAVWTPEVPADV